MFKCFFGHKFINIVNTVADEKWIDHKSGHEFSKEIFIKLDECKKCNKKIAYKIYVSDNRKVDLDIDYVKSILKLDKDFK